MNVSDRFLSRRTLLASAGLASAGLLAACSRKRAARYDAWLFIASRAEQAVVVSDLASFQRSGSIPLGAAPDQVLAAQGRVFAVCTESQTIVRIDALRRTITATIPVGGKIADAALTAHGDFLIATLRQPQSLVVIEAAGGNIVHRVDLPGIPRALAVSQNQAAIVLSAPPASKESDKLLRLRLPSGEILGVSPVDAGALNAIQYRKDGQTIFVAASDARQIVSLDAESGAVLARLPVPIRPARFCVDGTGGQVFVTGADQDPQLVIFSPYQNQVDQTLYAGRALFGMAVAPVRNLLFLSNPGAGDVSLVDVDTRRIAASVRTGGTPREILIAASKTDEEYAFVVDAHSGDVSVIHIPNLLHKSGDAFISEPPKPVFAVFNGGADPQSAVIVPYPA